MHVHLRVCVRACNACIWLRTLHAAPVCRHANVRQGMQTHTNTSMHVDFGEKIMCTPHSTFVCVCPSL